MTIVCCTLWSETFATRVSFSTVFDTYKKIYGSDIEDSIEGETTGNLENLMLAIGMFCDHCEHPVKPVLILVLLSPQ